MNADANPAQRAQSRISSLQQEVAERERSIQNKTKELIKREYSVDERESLLAKREQILQAQQQRRRLARRNKASLIAPILLITCVIAGYFAYEQINQQRQYFKQVKAAQAHVDKLTRVLNLTQARMVDSGQEVKLRTAELASTHTKLKALQEELSKMKEGAQSTPSTLQKISLAPSLESPLLDLLIRDHVQGASLETPQAPSAE